MSYDNVDTSKLQRDQSSMRYDLDRLESAQESLAERLRHLRDYDLDKLERGLQDELAQLGVDLRENIDEARTAVKSLASAVAWIERQIRADGNLTPVDLDTADATMHGLALRAERGRESQDALLDDSQRAGHTRRIDAYRELRATIKTSTFRALDHCRVIAATDLADPRHVDAGVGFMQELRTIEATRARRPAAQKAAEESQRALDHDDQQRGVHGPQVMTGEAASSTFNSRIRDRISTALRDGALMPTWFTTVLGHQPPADVTEQWLRTATSLLAYRITYTVTDPIVALGAPPASGDTDRRAAWYQELDRAMRQLRRWP